MILRDRYASMKIKLAPSVLFKGIPNKSIVWMSHGDYVKQIPIGWEVIAITGNGMIAGAQSCPHGENCEYRRKK